MNYTYISFKAPGPKSNKPTPVRFKWLIKFISLIIPMANPDFDDKIDEVDQWLVECETDSGFPSREIGMDEQQQVIMIMPYRKNYGYWIDNNLLLPDFIKTFNARQISVTEFDNYWTQFLAMKNKS